MRGPTIRRSARVGGGAILCPGVEIGEEAFVGAGAVVTKDVAAAQARRRQPGARAAGRRRRRAARERRLSVPRGAQSQREQVSLEDLCVASGERPPVVCGRMDVPA